MSSAATSKQRRARFAWARRPFLSLIVLGALCGGAREAQAGCPKWLIALEQSANLRNKLFGTTDAVLGIAGAAFLARNWEQLPSPYREVTGIVFAVAGARGLYRLSFAEPWRTQLLEALHGHDELLDDDSTERPTVESPPDSPRLAEYRFGAAAGDLRYFEGDSAENQTSLNPRQQARRGQFFARHLFSAVLAAAFVSGVVVETHQYRLAQDEVLALKTYNYVSESDLGSIPKEEMSGKIEQLILAKLQGAQEPQGFSKLVEKLRAIGRTYPQVQSPLSDFPKEDPLLRDFLGKEATYGEWKQGAPFFGRRARLQESIARAYEAMMAEFSAPGVLDLLREKEKRAAPGTQPDRRRTSEVLAFAHEAFGDWPLLVPHLLSPRDGNSENWKTPDFSWVGREVRLWAREQNQIPALVRAMKNHGGPLNREVLFRVPSCSALASLQSELDAEVGKAYIAFLNSRSLHDFERPISETPRLKAFAKEHPEFARHITSLKEVMDFDDEAAFAAFVAELQLSR